MAYQRLSYNGKASADMYLKIKPLGIKRSANAPTCFEIHCLRCKASISFSNHEPGFKNFPPWLCCIRNSCAASPLLTTLHCPTAFATPLPLPLANLVVVRTVLTAISFLPVILKQSLQRTCTSNSSTGTGTSSALGPELQVALELEAILPSHPAGLHLLALSGLTHAFQKSCSSSGVRRRSCSRQ